MAFAQIATTNVGHNDSNGTTHTINLPASLASGDLLMAAIIVNANNTITITTPGTGWTELFNSGTDANESKLYVFYRIADGGEGGTITATTSGSQKTAHITWRINAWHGTTPPECGTAATTTASTSINPPAVTPSWGSADTLYIVIGGWNGNSSHNGTWWTNYTGTQLTERITSGSGLISSARELNGTTDNPASTSVLGISAADVSNTIAVRPSDGSAPAIVWSSKLSTDSRLISGKIGG